MFKDSVLLYVAAFDVVVGILLARYVWLARRANGPVRVPASWAVLIALVNAGGLFCPARVEAAVATLGGAALIVLIVPAIGRLSSKEQAKPGSE